jgi:hypothetical protein
MKTIITILFAIVTLFLSAFTAKAQDTTVIQRYDGTSLRGGYTMGVIRPEGELWAFGLGTASREYDLGKLLPVKAGKGTHILVGGYLAYQEAFKELDLLPWVTADRRDGNVHLHADVAYYLPVSRGGTPLLFVNEVAATYRIGKRWEAGLAGNLVLAAGGTAHYGIGPKVSADLGHGMFASARVLFPGGGGEPQYRMVFGISR